MDKILKTLHLRLDSTSKSLTKNAVSQLIIKILFQHSSPISLIMIEKDLKSVLKTSIEQTRVEDGLEKLLNKQVIKYEKKKYSLTRSNRKTLKKNIPNQKKDLRELFQNISPLTTLKKM